MITEVDTHLINPVLFGDERGKLAVFQADDQLPFEVKRVFYLYDTDGDAVRGCHANRFSQFILIAVAGSCMITVKDGKSDDVIVSLDTPEKGLWLNKMIWKEMHSFSEGTVLLVLSDHPYDSGEYISHYDQYLELTKG